MLPPQSHFYYSGNVKLHYLHYPNNKPPLLLLHGLTANAYNFTAIIKAGLLDHFDIYALDLRGRGQSEQPPFHYAQEDHALDVVALVEHLGFKKMFFMGHSYGALLGIYISVQYGELVQKLIILDAIDKMNPQILEMLAPSLERLDKKFSNWDEYITAIKNAPFITQWYDEMEAYYRADIAPAEGGGVEPIPNLGQIVQVMQGNAAIDWSLFFRSVSSSVLLLYATEEYTLGMPLLWEEDARLCISEMPHAAMQVVPGNHVTMMYGEGAAAISEAAITFFK